MTKTRKATARAAAVRRVLSPAGRPAPHALTGAAPNAAPNAAPDAAPDDDVTDNCLRNAEINWQELQGIADRVRILKRVVTRLSHSIGLMQERARALRPGPTLLAEK